MEQIAFFLQHALIAKNRVEDQKKINKDQNNNKAMRSKEKLIRINKKQNLVT